MRLARITTNYPVYLRQFYIRNSKLRKKDYLTQYRVLMADGFGWADFWTHALRPLGYDVWEPVGNAEPMQKIWAREHGVEYDEDSWVTDILAAQIRFFQPEILFVDDHSTYSYDFIQHLRRENPSIKLIIGWCGAPYTDDLVFHAYDLVLSNIPEMVNSFRRLGHQAEHLHHAFAPRILEQIKHVQEPGLNFSFIGSINKSNLFHKQREQLIKKLVRKTHLKVFSDVSTPAWYRIGVQQQLYDATHKIGAFSFGEKLISAIPKLQRYHMLPKRPEFSDYVDTAIVRRASPPVFGQEMFQTLRKSKVTLNTHIGISPYSASNMRLFETTGVGACLLTDWKENLPELFDPELEVVTYRSVEECLEKVTWLLGHSQEREAIARAGQHRTLRDHTFEQRATQLNNIIRTRLKKSMHAKGIV